MWKYVKETLTPGFDVLFHCAKYNPCRNVVKKKIISLKKTDFIYMCALFGPEMSSKGDVLRSGTIGGQVLDRWTDDKIEEGCFLNRVGEQKQLPCT